MTLFGSLEEERAKVRASDVLTILQLRAIPVSDIARKCILNEPDIAELEKWLRNAVAAASEDEVFGDSNDLFSWPTVRASNPFALLERGWRAGSKAGWVDGWEDGRVEAGKRSVLAVLRVRGIAV